MTHKLLIANPFPKSPSRCDRERTYRRTFIIGQIISGCLITLFVSVVIIQPIRIIAQESEAAPIITVFAEKDVDDTGLDRIIFVNMLTGEEAAIEVYGDQYTLLDDAVMFFDYATNKVRLALPDGRVRDHPFIQLIPGSLRVDWVISEDGSRIAWTITHRDPQSRLMTTTYEAAINGEGVREVLQDVDMQNRVLRALPVAFSSDNSRLFMDYQPDRVSEFTPFKLYAQLFELDLATGATNLLPDEQGRCLCGASLRGGHFLRLRLTEDLTAFDLHVYDLDDQIHNVLDALRLNVDYDTGGDILITEDGELAVYALSRVSDFGLSSQSIRTVFVLVDLNRMTQEPLTQPIRSFVVPADWTEDNSAIILTNPMQNGTWKINLADGGLERIADATYLGRMGN